MEAAKQVLSSAGAKLGTHEMHIRRTADPGKYIVRHDLVDKHGNPPSDGQKATVEHAINSPQELQKHVAAHMDPGAAGGVPPSASEEPED